MNSDSTLFSVGAFDAKTRFSELLERAAAGEEITITKHGTPIAKLVPIKRQSTQESRMIAIEQMKTLASRNRLAGLKIEELRDEGRR